MMSHKYKYHCASLEEVAPLLNPKRVTIHQFIRGIIQLTFHQFIRGIIQPTFRQFIRGIIQLTFCQFIRGITTVFYIAIHKNKNTTDKHTSLVRAAVAVNQLIPIS